MSPLRQTYLLKLSRDEEGQLRIELQSTDQSPPHYFASLKELYRHLEAAFRPEKAAKQDSSYQP